MNQSSDLLKWLEAERRFPKFCWSNEKRTFAAVGARAVHTKLSKAAVYGGMRFNGRQKPATEWAPFGSSMFVEPEEVREGTISFHGEGVHLEPLDSFEEWQRRFDRARAAPFKKVVIARRFRGKCFSPYAAFAALKCGSGTAFFLAPDKDHAFFGASPERLFELEGGVVQVDSVAGTRPLTGNPVLDERYGRELLLSPKERHEHHLVTEHIERVLGFSPGEVAIRESGPVQHLCQEFVGATQLSSLELLKKLHPTPSVAGAPPSLIAEIEGFDRGWYGGPIGVLNGDDAFFAVAIRSGLWQRGSLTWYAGAGITEGSHARAEWEETDRKSKVMPCAKISI